ncbi:MAG: hypothetical protein M5R36_04945 [Deltaproteobacteria bacterium]|nr:hypothetical protein [Deltaproteobacteria bacterium]
MWPHLARFGISPKKFVGIYLDKKIGELWKTFGHRDLLTHLATGADRVAMQVVRKKFQETFGFLTEEEYLARLKTPEEHNQDYLWKILPEPLLKQNYEICGNFNFTESNPQWQNFEDEAKLASDKGQQVMFYLTPMNKSLIIERGLFNWDTVVPAYKENVYHVTRRYGHRLKDYTLAVNDAYFSDTDHINMNGHEQLAQRIAVDVHRQLKAKRARSDRWN